MATVVVLQHRYTASWDSGTLTCYYTTLYLTFWQAKAKMHTISSFLASKKAKNVSSVAAGLYSIGQRMMQIHHGKQC